MGARTAVALPAGADGAALAGAFALGPDADDADALGREIDRGATIGGLAAGGVRGRGAGAAGRLGPLLAGAVAPPGIIGLGGKSTGLACEAAARD